MTRSRSSRGRHRGRRGKPSEDLRPEGDDERQVSETRSPQEGERPDTSETTVRQRVETTVPPGGAFRSSGRSGGPARPQGQRGAGGPQQPPQQGPGGAGRNPRRRQPRRQPIVEVPGAIIKQRAPVSAGPKKMVKRSLEDLAGPEGPILGCPMLTRTRLALPVSGGRQAPRCSLGWGLHSEEEAMYCMLTPDLTQCWRANPERLDILRTMLEERDTAAD